MHIGLKCDYNDWMFIFPVAYGSHAYSFYNINSNNNFINLSYLHICFSVTIVDFNKMAWEALSVGVVNKRAKHATGIYTCYVMLGKFIKQL